MLNNPDGFTDPHHLSTVSAVFVPLNLLSETAFSHFASIMTVVHIGRDLHTRPYPSLPLLTNPVDKVLFKFRPEVTDAHRALFASKLKTLKALPSVKGNRLIVGGASITEPVERSQGYQHALLSFHEDRKALAEYQASDEHHE